MNTVWLSLTDLPLAPPARVWSVIADAPGSAGRLSAGNIGAVPSGRRPTLNEANDSQSSQRSAMSVVALCALDARLALSRLVSGGARDALEPRARGSFALDHPFDPGEPPGLHAFSWSSLVA